MKKKPQDQRDWHERRIEEARKKHVAPAPVAGSTQATRGKSATEVPKSPESSAKGTRKPREMGLANEARPGLGTRADNPDPAAIPDASPKEAKSGSKPKATKHGYEEPRAEPREQPSDSRAHDEERSTGVSGQSSGR